MQAIGWHVSHKIMTTTDGDYEVQLVAGHKFNQGKPLFSQDVNHVLVPSGTEVRMYSTETCSFLKAVTCPSAGADSFVSHIHLHPKRPSTHIVCFTNRGEMHIADLETGAIIFTKDLFALLHRDASKTSLRFGQAVVPHSQFKKCRSVLTIYFGIEKDAKIYCFSIDDPVQEEGGKQLKKAKFSKNVYNLNVVWHSTETPAIMLFSPTGSFLTVIQGNALYAQPLPYYDKSRSQKIHRICDKTDYMENITFSCITCHPLEETVATGLSDGRIIIWKNFVNDRKPVRITYHWHRERVIDLCFSAAGSILYSGGLEATLVSYEVSDGSLTFRSKLGVPIKMITCDQANRKIAILFDDNSMKLICSDLNLNEDVNMNLNELTYDIFSDRVDRMFYEPNSHSLVMKGSPGQLQFFSLEGKNKIQELDVITKNYDYSELSDITQMVITAFAVSADGNWIAASELWDDGTHLPEERLKFFTRRDRSYVLASTFHLPHAKHITGMAFSPDCRTLITTGNDAMFRIWQLRQRIEGEREHWTKGKSCQRNLIWQPSRVCFSSDSSIAAVQFEEMITFWSVDTGSLLTNGWMSMETSTESVVGMGFGGGNKSHMFMEARRNNMTVVNFLHGRTEFTVSVNDDSQSFLSACLDPETMRLLCMQANGNIDVYFNLSMDHKITLTAALKTPIITASTFVPSSALSKSWKDQEPAFLFFNENKELIAVHRKYSKPIAQGVESMEVVENEEPVQGIVPFLGQKLFIGTQEPAGKAVEPKVSRKKSMMVKLVDEFDVDKLVTDVFLKHSSQALPRIDLLCKSFMKHLLLHKMPVQETRKRKQRAASKDSRDGEAIDCD